MCTYQTTTLAVQGSGKGAQGWFPVSDATVYFDHPVHASADHTLNIDLLNPSRGCRAPGWPSNSIPVGPGAGRSHPRDPGGRPGRPAGSAGRTSRLTDRSGRSGYWSGGICPGGGGASPGGGGG